MRLILLLGFVAIIYLSMNRPNLFSIHEAGKVASKAVESKSVDLSKVSSDIHLPKEINSESVQKAYEWAKEKAPEAAIQTKQAIDQNFKPTVEQALQDLKIKLSE